MPLSTEDDTGQTVTVTATKPVSKVIKASPQVTPIPVQSSDNASSGPNAGVIGGAVGGSIGGIALVAVGLWVFVKYRKHGTFSKESKEELITSLADTYTPANGSSPDASDTGRGVSSIRSSPGKDGRNVNLSDVSAVVSPRNHSIANTPRKVMSNAAEKMRQAFYGINQTSATDYVAEATIDAGGEVVMESHAGPGKNKFMMFDSKVTHLTMKKDAIAKLHDTQGVGKKFKKKKVTANADLLLITEQKTPRSGMTPRVKGNNVEDTLGGAGADGIVPMFKRTLSRSLSGIKRTLSKGKIPKAVPEQPEGAAPPMSGVPDFPIMPSTSAANAAGVGIPNFPTVSSTSAANAAGMGGGLPSGSANVQRTDFKRNVLLQAQASGIQRVPSTGPRSPSSLLDLKAPLNPVEAGSPAQLSVAPSFKAFSIEDATASTAAAAPSSNKWTPAPVSSSGVHTVVRKGSVSESGSKKEPLTGKFPDGTFNSLGDA